jgi:cation diffusion facilitator CzcD-associated flavoprotein CzcO
MSLLLDVAIIGAGPYGLSLASHLQATDVNFRIFGKPMHAWRNHMPPGMYLKSDGDSLDLRDPGEAFTIHRFHDEHKMPFSSAQVVSRETFISYGLEFQARNVTVPEPHDVVSVEHDGEGYLLKLSNQELVRTKRVVLAVGVYNFRYLPPVIANLPPEFCTHSANYGSVEHLRGKKVAIVGAGASAIDLAVALAQHDVDTTVVSRRAELRFQTPPDAPQLTILSKVWGRIYRILMPGSGIGEGWVLKFYADAPHVFRLLPAKLRSYLLRVTLGPASTFVTKDILASQNTPILLSHAPIASAVVNGKVHLTVENRKDKSTRVLEVDHVIGATGYQVDIEKLPFLAASIRTQIRTHESAPELSQSFESTCRGIYFVGPATAMSFGPVMRFVFGAGFTMKRITKHLVRLTARRASPQFAVQSTINH